MRQGFARGGWRGVIPRALNTPARAARGCAHVRPQSSDHKLDTMRCCTAALPLCYLRAAVPPLFGGAPLG
ncbi:hypothetical protein EON67_07160 [archaeon]|nr:MAG: hypothetical protein EON67_07160 [archaeon]